MGRLRAIKRREDNGNVVVVSEGTADKEEDDDDGDEKKSNIQMQIPTFSALDGLSLSHRCLTCLLFSTVVKLDAPAVPDDFTGPI